MTLTKEDYEKYIKKGVMSGLVITPLFEELMQKHGIFCTRCKRPFIPQPFYRENYPRAHHYPTESVCGFCVYDMDSYEHSQLLDHEDEPTCDYTGEECCPILFGDTSMLGIEYCEFSCPLMPDWKVCPKCNDFMFLNLENNYECKRATCDFTIPKTSNVSKAKEEEQ